MTARLVTLVLAVALLAACGIPRDSSPRDVPEEEQLSLEVDEPDTPRPGNEAGPKVYFVTSGSTPTDVNLEGVGRNVAPTPVAVLTELLKGVTSEEAERRLRTAIPRDTELRRAELRVDGTLIVDLSDEFFEATGESQIAAVAQIVVTGTALDRVDRVRLLVDGQEREWPRGDGTLQGAPLTAFDYPALNPTSQPDYPPLPVPAAAAPTTTAG